EDGIRDFHVTGVQTCALPIFDRIGRDLIARTMTAVRRVLRDAKADRSEVEGVVMVGGATRMPQVQAAVTDFFGRAPLTDLDPDRSEERRVGKECRWRGAAST